MIQEKSVYNIFMASLKCDKSLNKDASFYTAAHKIFTKNSGNLLQKLLCYFVFKAESCRNSGITFCTFYFQAFYWQCIAVFSKAGYSSGSYVFYGYVLSPVYFHLVRPTFALSWMINIIFLLLGSVYLFSNCLDQETAKRRTSLIFESSCHLLLPF